MQKVYTVQWNAGDMTGERATWDDMVRAVCGCVGCRERLVGCSMMGFAHRVGRVCGWLHAGVRVAVGGHGRVSEAACGGCC